MQNFRYQGRTKTVYSDRRSDPRPSSDTSRSSSRSESYASSESERSYASDQPTTPYPRRFGKYYETDSGVCRRVDIALDEIDDPLPSNPEFDVEVANKWNIELDSIPAPELTPEEKLLPEAQRKMRELLKKCQSVQCYNFFSIREVIDILREPTSPGSMIEASAVFQCGDGAHQFYLTWASEADKLEFLINWLTHQILDGEVADLEPTTLSGNLVSVFSATDGFYYRGQVMKVDEQTEMVDAFLVDTGKTVKTAVDKLKGLPEELITIPAFAFKCRLANINYRMDPQLDFFARRDFTRIVRGDGPLQCAIKGFERSTRVWEVHLKKGQPPINLNVYIGTDYNARRQFLTLPGVSRDEVSPTLGDYDQEAFEPTIEEHGKIELKGLRSFRVTHVESPSQFYIQYAAEAEHGIGVLSLEALQMFYNAIGDDEYKLCTARTLVGRCYAWKDTKTGIWERVRVTATNGTTRTCQIYLVDNGRTCEVDYSSLRELVPKFINICARGFRAYLVDLKPLNRGANGDSDWSGEACAALRKLAVGKSFHGIIVERKDFSGNLMLKSTGESFSLGLILIEKDSAVKYCLNAALCLMGLAEPCGVSSGYLPLGVPESTSNSNLYNFDEMKKAVDIALQEEAEREQEDAPIDEGDMLSGAAPLSKIDRKKLLSKKQKEDEATNKMGYYFQTFMSRANKTSETLNRLPLAIRNKLGACHMTHILSPSIFYVQMADQVPILKVLMQYLGQKIVDYPQLSEEQIIDGLLVAVYLLDENGKPSWHRAIVKHAIFSIKLVKVVLVDFGNEVSVKYNTVRNLPEYFWNIPGYAQRVHLDVQDLRPYGKMLSWSNEAGEAFRKYLAVWEPELPVYYVWKRLGASTVELDEYNQDVALNAQTGAWEKGHIRVIPHERNMKRINDTRIGQNLYTSIGVDIVYEVLTKPQEAYGFEKIWNILITKGLATTKKD